MSSVVTNLQSTLDRPVDLWSDGSDRLPPSESGSDNSWGPGPNPGGFRGQAVAAPDGATPCPRSAAERRSVTNG